MSTRRLTTYDQLNDYPDMQLLQVAVIDGTIFLLGKNKGLGASFHVQEGMFLDRSTYSSFVEAKAPRESIHKHLHILSCIIREVLDEIRVMSRLSMHRNVATFLGVVLEESASCLRLSWSDLLDRSEVFSGNRRKGFLDIPILSRLRCRSRSPSLRRNRTRRRRRQVRQHPHLLYGSKLALIIALPSMLTAKVSDFGFCVLDATAWDLTVGARGNVQFKTPETLYESTPSLRQYANLPQLDLYSYGAVI
ncbi:uncharacterized protein ARMOST_01380 [Armillaria ostoyae]|uniref:Protein kinase domain-containing protein n=1 Tax=Armillaria ostoyae TaxID=47428 RepID=A0A284QNQ4_ARMOS|nr:uncharacterized protein ARMOST_01380 [Armillaria ostoyae]